jgi:hypothetical protein
MTEFRCLCLPHAWFLDLRQGLVQVQGEFLERPVEEEFEEFLAKLKLLLEGKLVQSLVNLRLLAEMKVDSFLVRLELLLDQGIEPLGRLKLLVGLMGSFLVKLALLFEEEVIGSLARLKFLLDQEMIEALVNLDLKHAEERRSLQDGSPMFLEQMPDKMQV